MQPVTIYASTTCGYCVQAENLLRSEYPSAAITKIMVDSDRTKLTEMMERTGARSVPQIFIGTHHVGGYSNLAELHAAGGVLPLLTAPPLAEPA
jgi:glutaredoxin 3